MLNFNYGVESNLSRLQILEIILFFQTFRERTKVVTDSLQNEHEINSTFYKQSRNIRRRTRHRDGPNWYKTFFFNKEISIAICSINLSLFNRIWNDEATDIWISDKDKIVFRIILMHLNFRLDRNDVSTPKSDNNPKKLTWCPACQHQHILLT